MKTERIIENKKRFLDLLLLTDEQEGMIDKYLPNGELFALYDDDLKGILPFILLFMITVVFSPLFQFSAVGKGFSHRFAHAHVSVVNRIEADEVHPRHVGLTIVGLSPMENTSRLRSYSLVALLKGNSCETFLYA